MGFEPVKVFLLQGVENFGSQENEVFERANPYRTRDIIANVKWRRGRDSNPRNAQTLNGFQDRRFQPLSHLSEHDLLTALWAKAQDHRS